MPKDNFQDLGLDALIEQDQGERGEYLQSPSPENWQLVTDRDRLRRERVVELLHQDQIQTAEDYFNAGIIMLHGTTTEEFILSHVFAMAAMAKGNPAAAWLSGVTFDSVLESLEQKQIFDAQSPEKSVSINDSLREIFAIPAGDED